MAFDSICPSADRDMRSLCLGKCGECHVEHEGSPEWHLIAFVLVPIGTCAASAWGRAVHAMSSTSEALNGI